MSRAKAFGFGIFLLGAAAAAWILFAPRETHTVYDPPIKQIEPASPCPWRDAGEDMTNWFPGATEHSSLDLVLSGKSPELQQTLGRRLLPEEMALHTYPVLSNHVHLGTVLTRRLKGEHGGIEMALALDTNRQVKALKVQRIREPEHVVRALEQYNLNQRFKQATLNDDLVASLQTENRTNGPADTIARAIAAETKTLLVLFEAGQAEFRISTHHH